MQEIVKLLCFLLTVVTVMNGCKNHTTLPVATPPKAGNDTLHMEAIDEKIPPLVAAFSGIVNEFDGSDYQPKLGITVKVHDADQNTEIESTETTSAGYSFSSNSKSPRGILVCAKDPGFYDESAMLYLDGNTELPSSQVFVENPIVSGYNDFHSMAVSVKGNASTVYTVSLIDVADGNKTVATVNCIGNNSDTQVLKFSNVATSHSQFDLTITVGTKVNHRPVYLTPIVNSPSRITALHLKAPQ